MTYTFKTRLTDFVSFYGQNEYTPIECIIDWTLQLATTINGVKSYDVDIRGIEVIFRNQDENEQSVTNFKGWSIEIDTDDTPITQPQSVDFDFKKKSIVIDFH
jgi:hypothetical protein